MTQRDLLYTVAAALFMMATPGYAQIVLEVNQTTGLVEIHNSSATNTVNLNGYDLRSIQNPAASNDGLLSTSGWSRLATSLGNGWMATNFPSSERLLETNANNVLSLAPGAKQSLGNAFTTSSAAINAAQTLAGFGNEYRDVTFQYTDAGNNSAIVNGTVNYTGTIYNNLVLNVDTNTGNITLKNESAIAVEIEAYTITSAAGSLNTSWNGLSDTVANWQKNISTENALAELSALDLGSNPGAPLAPLTIHSGATYDLGTAFNMGGTEDLAFSFLLTSDIAGNGFAGVVRYLSGVAGDYNGDGMVNLADYTVWRDTLGSTTDLRADGNNSGGIEAGDYSVWKSNFGLGSGGALVASNSQVPEPASLVLVSVLLAIGVAARRR